MCRRWLLGHLPTRRPVQRRTVPTLSGRTPRCIQRGDTPVAAIRRFSRDDSQVAAIDFASPDAVRTGAPLPQFPLVMVTSPEPMRGQPDEPHVDLRVDDHRESERQFARPVTSARAWLFWAASTHPPPGASACSLHRCGTSDRPVSQEVSRRGPSVPARTDAGYVLRSPASTITASRPSASGSSTIPDRPASRPWVVFPRCRWRRGRARARNRRP